MDNQNQVIDKNEQNKVVERRDGPVNLGRHQAQCSICRSEYRQEIEELFIDWKSPDEIAKIYTSCSRDSLYRHANALDLRTKRRNNYMTALERIIERVDRTPISGSGIVSAIKELAKMVREKQSREDSDPKKLLPRVSPAEGEAVASDGTLPESLSGEKVATPDDSHKEEEEGQTTESKMVQ